MQLQTEKHEEEFAANPLDHVEAILDSHNWVFNRVNADELMLQVTGKSCDYRLFFIWDEDLSALQFCAQYDLTLPAESFDAAGQALMQLNAGLWLGHFDLPCQTGTPSLRYTLLCPEGDAGVQQIESVMDIVLAQCERAFPAFNVLSNAAAIADKADLSLALMETRGES